MGVCVFIIFVFLLLGVFVVYYFEVPSEFPSVVEFAVLLLFVGCEFPGYVVLMFRGLFTERGAEVRWAEVALLLIGFTRTVSTLCRFMRRCGSATSKICSSSCC